MSRVYAPLDLVTLDALCSGELAQPNRAFTVTPPLRTALGGLDEEELEHLTTQLAVAASPTHPKAVVALEIAPSRIAEVSDELALCTLNSGIRMKDVVCFFIADGEPSDDADVEMSWYDFTEADLVRQKLSD